MRCVTRVAVVAGLVVAFVVYVLVSRCFTEPTVDENDEETRRLLEGAAAVAPAPTTPRQPLPLSVAVVLVVSLISVALLITGIIIIAVTLDPSSDDESDLDTDNDQASRSATPIRPYHSSFEMEYDTLFSESFSQKL